MKVKSSRTFVGIFIILLLVFVPFSTTIHPALATTSTGVIVPLYSYPGSTWTQIIQAKNAHPSVPIMAIINPNSGPGSASDPNFVTGIKNLQTAGITVLGYVYTSYAARSTAAAEADINSYKTWYNVNGIMFDEMSNVPGNENYYSTLTLYVKSHGMPMTVGNPGASTLASYVGTVDNITIYEGSGVPTISSLITRVFYPTYPSSDFSMVSYGVSTLDTTAETNASPYVSYLYITNDVLSNPYDTVPSYFGTEVAALDTGSSATAPGSPTSLTATTVSTSQINLSWNAPSNNGGSSITGYKIERSTDSGTTWSTIVANTATTSVAYSDTGLTASTSYTYRVSAINSVGTSSPSNTSSVTTMSGSTITAPQPPTGLTVTAASSSQINLSWAAPSSNGGSAITGYKIERSTDSGTTWSTILANTSNTATTSSDTGLATSTTYTYRVSAINSVGTSSPSNTASTTTSGNTGTTQVTISVNSVDLSGNPITGMSTVIRYTNSTTISDTFTPTSFTVTSGTTYVVHVRDYQTNVFNHWQDGTTNSYYTITPTQNVILTAYYSTGTTVTAPQPPTGLTTTSTSSSQINLSWTAPSNNGGAAISGYKIEKSTDSGTTWNTIVPNTATTSTAYSDTGLTASTAYTYRASAINSVGTSSPSNIASATTQAPPATSPQPPTGLTSIATLSSQINLGWTAPANNGGSAITGYKIERSTDSGTTWSTLVANTATTSVTYSDTGLATSTTYTYRVSAINSVGTSSPSNTASATTLEATTPLVKLTVNSANLAGTQFSGMWIELHASNGTTLATGYTPITFTVTSGVQYYVHAANYKSTIFKHWNDGTTVSSLTITPTQNTSLTAYYSTPVTLTVNSVNLAGVGFSGMWTVIQSNGVTVASGYTSLKYTAQSGNTYTVTVANYQNYVFSHWSDDSTNPTKTITPTTNTTLVAYYST